MVGGRPGHVTPDFLLDGKILHRELEVSENDIVKIVHAARRKIDKRFLQQTCGKILPTPELNDVEEGVGTEIMGLGYEGIDCLFAGTLHL